MQAFVGRRAGRIGVGIVAAAVLASFASAYASPAGAAGSGRDGRWSVAREASGYRIVLQLAQPLPVRDALPELAVDGVSVGAAKESPDGSTLTTVTTAVSAATPHDVELAWNGVSESFAAATPAAATTTTPAVTPAGLTAAATASGPYSVSRADYDFGDQAVTLGGLGGRFAELRAAAWVPSAPGQRPVIIFLHGRHAACYNPTTSATDNTHWPCLDGFVPIPSYHGYDQSAQVLASQGYVVVSISADGINAQDNPDSDDAGTLARGQLVLDHLDLLTKANEGRAAGMSPLLKNKLDLDDVGLMGHSRGGEGVVKAALLNAARPHPYGINAVLPLAPIDFGRETLPDVPTVVVLPYCDGDVSNQQGQHFYDDTRYADPSDDVLRSSLMVMGADHNFFNTEWTPGVSVAPSSDDWRDQADPTCSPSSPTTTRLSAADQYQVGVALISGFFQLVIGGDRRFLPMFDGSGGASTSVGAATVYTQTQAPDRADVAPLTGPAPGVTFSGAATGQYCASIANRTPMSSLPGCTTSTFTSRFPSWTPANYAGNVEATPLLHFTWTGPGSTRISVPPGKRDASRFDALTFRAAIDDVSAGSDLTVTVLDGSGHSQSVAVSSLSDALATFPGTPTNLLPKTWLRTVRWPVAQMTGVNVRDIRQIVLTAPSSAGGAFLSDVAFQTSAVGAGGPSPLPQVSIVGTSVDEGDGPGSATVTLTLSARSAVPVTANVQTLAGTGTQIETQAERVVIAAGKRSVAVDVPLDGDTTQQVTADTVYKAFVSAPVGAVVGQDFAHITVHDDEAP